MQNPITETAHATLNQYANYREKQLLSVGDIEACFVSVISRLQRSTNRFLWVTRLRNISVVVFVAWLAYDSAVRDDLTILTCFIPMFLLMISPQFSVLSKVWHSVTHVETVAELWRKYDLETRPPNDRTAATT